MIKLDFPESVKREMDDAFEGNGYVTGVEITSMPSTLIYFDVPMLFQYGRYDYNFRVSFTYRDGEPYWFLSSSVSPFISSKETSPAQWARVWDNIAVVASKGEEILYKYQQDFAEYAESVATRKEKNEKRNYEAVKYAFGDKYLTRNQEDLYASWIGMYMENEREFFTIDGRRQGIIARHIKDGYIVSRPRDNHGVYRNTYTFNDKIWDRIIEFLERDYENE